MEKVEGTIRWQDVINPIKWWSYIQGMVISLFLKKHIIEQYHFRLLMCKQCVNQGSCIHCGCNMPAKAWVSYETCSAGNWGKIKSKEDWEKYKQDFRVEMRVFINSEIIN